MTEYSFTTDSGNRALEQQEPLIYDIGDRERTGVDLEEIADFDDRLGGITREGDIGLVGLSEPEAMRHYTRLSRKNYAIDIGRLIPARLLYHET